MKDLSFENPDAPASFQKQRQGDAPPLNVSVNVGAKPVNDTEFEVELRMEAKAGTDDSVIFAVELIYAGMFKVQNVPQDQLHPLIMTECPRMLFPFARQILAEVTHNGSFPPLMLDPIDFAQLYRQNMAQQQAKMQAGDSPTN